MQKLIKVLREQKCSLAVKNHGTVTCYNKPGVRDLERLLDHEPKVLRGAIVADKVTGKAAAAMVAVGGVKELYAEVMSKKAIPFLKQADIKYSYGTLVASIIEEKDRCPLEMITEPAATPIEAVALLRAHFAEMQSQKQE